MKMKELLHRFHQIYITNKTPSIFFAPGRINLIGEHTDYNGGHVFPAAISLGTYALGIKRNDQMVRFFSLNAPETGIIECNLADLTYKEKDTWANYPKGMLQYIMESEQEINTGADILYYGNIPNGAGLSSSASIELVTAILAKKLFQLKLDNKQMVHLAKNMENEYIGVKSGLMDQFSVVMGKKNHAVLLNCQTLHYEYAEIKQSDFDIIIINSNKERALAGSKYNERRLQCEQALADLQTKISINHLADMSIESFKKYSYLIKDESNRKRAKHVIYENSRTLEALESLRADDLEHFGRLMNESHISLQQDYEVTGNELDTIVEAAWGQEGVIGSRMTGAGFGGCAIAFVESKKANLFKKNINYIYQKKFGYGLTFYTAKIDDGVREISRGVTI